MRPADGLRLAALLAVAPLAAFDPAVDLPLAVHQGALVLELPAGVHLKVRTFKVALASGPGRVAVRALPPADGRDEAGDPVWRGRIRIPLAAEGTAEALTLLVTLQPCTEGPEGRCWLPLRRPLAVRAEDLRAAE